MPDWVTHIAVAWTLCRILSFRYREFNTTNTMIVIAGALIPDISKIALGLSWIDIDATKYLATIYTSSGSIIVAGIISVD